MRLAGLLLAFLPLSWWAWELHHDPCGLQGKAWQECRAHHSHHTPHHDHHT